MSLVRKPAFVCKTFNVKFKDRTGLAWKLQPYVCEHCTAVNREIMDSEYAKLYCKLDTHLSISKNNHVTVLGQYIFPLICAPSISQFFSFFKSTPLTN